MVLCPGAGRRLGEGGCQADGLPPAPLWQGLYEKALEDSEKALGLDSENIRALFRKARALTELGRHKEAYACSSRCSLALPHVSAASLAEARLPALSGPKRLTALSLAFLC